MTKQEELLKALVEEGIVNTDQAREVWREVKEKNKNVEDVILRRKLVDEEGLAKLKAKLYNLPYTNLLEKKIKQEVLNIIPQEVAENYNIICFAKAGSIIKVGISDPENFKALEAVDFLAKEHNLTVQYYLISKKSFQNAFKQYKSLAEELTSALKTREEEEKKKVVTAEEKEKEELGEITKTAPVVKIVSVIIRHAVEGGASDIHIEPLFKESRVRYRIDGVLHTSLILPRSVHNAIVARIKVMANLKLDETRLPQDGRIRLVIDEKRIDFRVSTLPVMGAEKVVMRILDTTKGAPKLEELGFQGEQLKVIENSLTKTEGIILVTGPTGSGKSTTLFSVLDILNKEGVNIATLEDPVEYQMEGINQSQVKPEIGYTFAAGLRSFLRQDPDIIMVGEIRDEETAELAIHAALTGHLVLSTLHTIDAPGTVARLVDMKVQSFLLGSTLTAIVAQRLVRRICPHCREEVKLPDNYVKEIKEEIKIIGEDYIKEIIPDFNPNKLIFHKGRGCSRCGNTGYSGRLAIAEVLDVTDDLKELILGGRKHLKLEEIRKSQRFITVKQDGIIKVLQGLTTIAEVLRVMKH
jgi:type IV pilus assembly protein PilB